MNAPKHSVQNLICLLSQRYARHSFREGTADITNWFLRLIRWPENIFCCGAAMTRFTGYYRTSGLPDDHCAYYGCQWCGRVE